MVMKGRSTVPLDWSQCAVVERIPGKVSGAGLFKGLVRRCRLYLRILKME
jgi:hypothetical protein